MLQSRLFLWLVILVLFIFCIGLGNLFYNSSSTNNQLMKDINSLQSSLSIKPKVIKIDSIVYNDRIFNVYKTPKISQDNNTAKALAMGSKGKMDSLTKVLNIKDKDLLSYKEINASLLLENKKLSETKYNPNKVEFKDKYITLVIDKNNNMIDTLYHKINIASASYMKSPKWYKGKEENYMLSADDKRVTLGLNGFDSTPKNIKSMVYVDTRYQLNPKTFSDGFLSSTLNYEFGMDNVVSTYVGGGMQTDFASKPQGVVNVGMKVNIYRKKK